MPNYCQNNLRLFTPTEALMQFICKHHLSFAAMLPVEEDTNDARWDAWGTKWDMTESEAEEAASQLEACHETYFDTAWSPPSRALHALSKMFPTDIFQLVWYEPGNRCAGSIVYAGGLMHDLDADGDDDLFNHIGETYFDAVPGDENGEEGAQ